MFGTNDIPPLKQTLKEVIQEYRGLGYGTRLLAEIEKYYQGKRYELFTSTRSEANIRLYEKNGYRIFDRKPVNDDLVFVYMEKN